MTQNRRGEPLITGETAVNPTGNTKTRNGLKTKAVPDEKIYDKGGKAADDESASVHPEKAAFHGEWNYEIKPEK